MMLGMPTTVELPPDVHRGAHELARSRGQSLPAVIADLAPAGWHNWMRPSKSPVIHDPVFP
jgi:hypothetical protein